jgi:uncharacterized protein (TIGR00255 family)
MIRSMTGFGRAGFEVDGSGFEVEVRSVNQRHLDTRVRLPRSLSDHEGLVKARIQARLQRGKIDCSVSPVGGGTSPGRPELDREVAEGYVAAARELAQRFGLADDLSTARLLGLAGVMRFVEKGPAPEALAAALGAAVDAAVTGLDAMRAAEGAALARELEGRLVRIEDLVACFESRAADVLAAARARLRRRSEQIREETGLQDEARLYQEIVIAADRLDITEELVRLRSHIAQFRGILAQGSAAEPVGRRLEFLLQEFGREANTVGSKASDAALSHQVVELKNELERIREQVQNVE